MPAKKKTGALKSKKMKKIKTLPAKKDDGKRMASKKKSKKNA